MTRPRVRIFERKRVHFPPGFGIQYTDPHEGVFAEVSYESEIRVGESEGQAVRRAQEELTAALKSGSGAVRAESLEERLRKMTEEERKK